jgi:signal transduction histidine kinase
VTFRQKQIAVFLGTILVIFGTFAIGLSWISRRLTAEATLQTAILLARQVEIALADSLNQIPPQPGSDASPWEFLGRIFPGGRQTKPGKKPQDSEVRELMQAYMDRSAEIAAIWVLNSDGQVLYTSGDRQKGEVLTDPQLQENLRQGTTTIASRREGDVTYYDVLVPLQMPKGAVGPGGLRLWINPASFGDLVGGLRREMALLLALGGGLALGSALLTTFMYSRRFRLIAETLRQAESGTYQARPSYPSRDEVATSLDLIDRLVMKQKSAGELAAPLRRFAVATRTLAHEVRNPLNALAVHLELLRNGSRKGDEADQPSLQQKSLATMESAVRQMDEIVRDFTDYTAPVALEKKSMDLSQVLGSSLDAAKGQCTLQGIEVATHLPPGPWWVRGDSTRLRQAFDNLLRNAVEAQPNGGSIRISGEIKDAQITLRLADSGPGIPEDRRATLFDYGRSSKPGGSGIGLPLSQLIIEAHGGTLICEQQNGSARGATFCITLPIAGRSDS